MGLSGFPFSDHQGPPWLDSLDREFQVLAQLYNLHSHYYYHSNTSALQDYWSLWLMEQRLMALAHRENQKSGSRRIRMHR